MQAVKAALVWSGVDHSAESVLSACGVGSLGLVLIAVLRVC